MPSVAAGFRAGHVAIEVRVHRAGNMRGRIVVLAPVDIVELEAAVHDHERLITQMECERAGRDERGEGHYCL
jgi:hypothetical protein